MMGVSHLEEEKKLLKSGQQLSSLNQAENLIKTPDMGEGEDDFHVTRGVCPISSSLLPFLPHVHKHRANIC